MPFHLIFKTHTGQEPIPVAVIFNVWVCGLSLAGTWVRIPPGSWMSVVSVGCCQVEVLQSVVCLSVISKAQ